MFRMPDATHEAKEDLFYGQIVVIMSRWFLILAGVVLALWQAETIAAVTLPITLMIVLMVMNFYLHGRYLLRRPVNGALVYASSAIDLAVIVLVVLFWTVGRGGGPDSPFYVFLYPAILAFALVFPPRITFAYTSGALATYVGAIGLGFGFGGVSDQKDLLMRVVTLAATAGLGTYFWRIQRRRRSRSKWRRDSLLEDIEALTSSPSHAR
jgi:hypothetical protein